MSSLSVGIVGLPNVGKSTIFNALTKSSVPAENYPFCTIDPNIGIVPVPDTRLKQLDNLVHSQRIVPAVVQFVDIAGLVKGAANGEGLGNQFLTHIRDVDAIVHILRGFEDTNITHVEGRIDPLGDLEIINTEIGLKDLETLSKLISGEERKLKSGDKLAPKRMEILKTIEKSLQDGKFDINLSDDDRLIIKDVNLLSIKPKIYVLNVSEEDLNKSFDLPFEYIKVSAKFESELADLDENEKREMLDMAGIKESGLEVLTKQAYRTLNLIDFFTAGEMEVRAWTIKKGTKAPEASGVIHTDFMNNFIRLEVVSFDDYIKYGSWNGAKDKGVLRSEGKEYVVQDGDVVIVRHS